MSKLFRVIALSLVLVFLISFSLTGCKKETAMTKIRLIEVTHSLFYTPQYVALTKGFFADEGLDVELINGKGADKCMTALLSNEAEIGFMGPEASVYVYNQGRENYEIGRASCRERV